MPHDDSNASTQTGWSPDGPEPRVIERPAKQAAPHAGTGTPARAGASSGAGRQTRRQTDGATGAPKTGSGARGGASGRSKTGAQATAVGDKATQAQNRPAPSPSSEGGNSHRRPEHSGKGGSPSGKRAPKRPQKPAEKIDPRAATIDKPAHPLPAVRMGQIDYDRYLMHETDKFKIFSAEERRARNRHFLVGLVIAVVVALILAWAVASRALG